MSDNHIIPVSNGLFEHRLRLGPAIWEFLWCIDAITEEEVDESGMRWGLVLGGALVKHERIAKALGSSERTVQRNMIILKREGYIQTIRTARGEIIKVAKNKKAIDNQKRYDKTGVSYESDTPNMAHHDERYARNGISDESDTPNVAPLKDFKDLITTTSTSNGNFDFDNIEKDPYLELLGTYCELNKRLDIHVKPKEREAMGKMVAGGMPNPFTIRTMEILLEEKREREGNAFKYPTSFLYYENGIWEAWRNEQPIVATDSTNGAFGGKRKTKQEKQMEMLDQIAREEREHGQSRSE